MDFIQKAFNKLVNRCLLDKYIKEKKLKEYYRNELKKLQSEYFDEKTYRNMKEANYRASIDKKNEIIKSQEYLIRYYKSNVWRV